MKKKKPVRIWLRSEEYELLTEEAKRRDTKKAPLVKMIVMDFLEKFKKKAHGGNAESEDCQE